jgi:hypothetical protein
VSSSSAKSAAKSVAASKPRRTRRSAEATRDLMLRAGTRLAVDRLREADEDAASRALAHIRLTDVAKVATDIERGEGHDRGAITTGAIYQFWPNQAAFQADLMVHLLTEEPLPAEDRLASRTLELIASGSPIDDIMAELSIMAYRIARTTDVYDLSLLFVPYSKLPRVGEALRKSYRDQARSSRPIYQALLMAGGLRIREPWTLEDVMSAISALHDGLRIQEHASAVDGGSEHGEQVVSQATVALFRAFTEPA